ncbi:MAG: hypothetical protein HQL51_12380 [Magnetococcales bacterium]|nr:hypothetical protein [Magnetococcales bacterium]
MDKEELNGWLVYSAGQALKIAISPGPWESDLVVMLLLPTVDQRDNAFFSALIPADPDVTLEELQQALGLNHRRAEMAHQAFLDALQTLSGEEPAPTSPPRPVIPILAR